MEKDKVSLPVDTNGRIDFDFMETYIRAIMKQTIGKLKSAMDLDAQEDSTEESKF